MSAEALAKADEDEKEQIPLEKENGFRSALRGAADALGHGEDGL